MKDDISNYFALTIFKLAKKHSKEELADLENAINEFADLLSSNNDLFLFLNHPSIPMVEKDKLVEKIIPNLIALRLITLLIRIKKISEIFEIKKTISNLIKSDNNYIDAEVKLSIVTGNEEADKIKKAIEAYTAKKVNLLITIDPSIIGGIYLKIENTIFDYSIIKQLNLFKERFNSK